MASLFNFQSVPRDAAERLRIAVAVASEQVLEEHVAWALEVVAEGADRAPVERLLAAYSRLHYLEEGQQRQLYERVLAHLGRDSGTPWAQREIAEPRSPFRRLARRLRGRVHHDLRDWVERHTARVQLALVDLHVRHALEFVRILEAHVPAGEALDMYARRLRLRATTAEFVRLKALLALHASEPAARVEPLHPRPSRLPLRVADKGS